MEHTGKRALVLAGGGAKGSYQIGVWRALQELDWTPDIITGASVGTLNGCLFNDELDFDRDWLADARRYYGNIVGKYGPQVQAALKKVGGLEIAMICPNHGPVWRSDLGYLLNKYSLWSQYQPEEQAVAIFYGSMYGDTENAANILACKLADAGVKNIAMYDVSSTHV